MIVLSMFRAEHYPLKRESDLKFFYQNFFRKAFFVAAVIHYAGVGTYWGVWYIQQQSKVYSTRIITYADLGPPPALSEAPPIPEVDVAAPSKPVIGIPEPVDDTEVSAEMTIATQTEMSQSVAPVIQEMDEADIIIEAPQEENIVLEDDALPSSDQFVAYEDPPVPISQPPPVYPEMARKAGVEGMVILHVLVDKEGNVRDIRLIKGIGAGLDESAIASVRQSKWTPAIQNHKPVSVWVSYPVRFKLR